MKVQYSKRFEKSFKKCSARLQKKITQKIEIFIDDPYNQRLRNHPLRGVLKGIRAFSVTGDIRIIFEEIDDYILVIFLDVGKHAQIYK